MHVKECYFIHKIDMGKLDMGMHASNPSTEKAEAGGLPV
jgi:hypothetical protein